MPKAVAAAPFLALKGALLLRASQSDQWSELDMLLMASSGYTAPLDAVLAESSLVTAGRLVTLAPPPGLGHRLWVPLLQFIVCTGKQAIEADLIDPELTRLSGIARTRWPELLGRVVALQMSIDRKVVPQSLRGICCTKLSEALLGDGDAWRKADLGHAVRKARAAMQGGTVAAPDGNAYKSQNDLLMVNDVASPIAKTFGFDHDPQDEGSLPKAVAVVLESHRLYYDGAKPHTKTKIADEGRALILATLHAMGSARWAVLTAKNPDALDFRHQGRTPVAAQQRFDRHMEFLRGAAELMSYMPYLGGGGGGGGGGDGGAGGGGRRRRPCRACTT